MANILLTSECVRSCPYCFAKKHMMDSNNNDFLSWENLVYLCDFLEASNEKRVSLLGGEPTLHPNFSDYLIYLSKRNFAVTVFTSGIMQAKKVDELKLKLKKEPNAHIFFVCNTNAPDLSTAKEISQIEYFFNELSNYITLGYNIYNENFNLEFIVNYIEKYNLTKEIRLGLAHPIPDEKNEHIPKNKYGEMKISLVNNMELFEKKRISFSFDCGMPLCIFNDSEIGRFYKLNKTEVCFTCNPPIDIGTDMNVWSCFPLSKYKKSIYEFQTIQEIEHFFSNRFKEIRSEKVGIFEECKTCIYYTEKTCAGGCVAHILSN